MTSEKALKLLSDFRGQLRDRPFRPHRLLRGGHSQTVVAARLKRNFRWGWNESRVETIRLEDGTTVRIQAVYQEHPAPTLVAFHGTGGSSESIYMQAISHKAFREGWNCLLLNLYNSNLRRHPPRIFHAGSSQLAAEVVARIIDHSKTPFEDAVKRGAGGETGPCSQPILLVGVSLGGNILLKMLAEWGSNFPSPILAAAVLSPLCDLTRSWSSLDRLPNRWIYRSHFVNGLKRIVQGHQEYLQSYVDVSGLLQVESIRQFDELFTAPLGGFRDAMDYYVRASAAPLLQRIEVPTLVLHSKDDPLLPWEPLASARALGNRRLLIRLTETGGHAGFLEQDKRDIDRSWAENRIMDFFRMAMVVSSP